MTSMNFPGGFNPSENFQFIFPLNYFNFLIWRHLQIPLMPPFYPILHLIKQAFDFLIAAEKKL